MIVLFFLLGQDSTLGLALFYFCGQMNEWYCHRIFISIAASPRRLYATGWEVHSIRVESALPALTMDRALYITGGREFLRLNKGSAGW